MKKTLFLLHLLFISIYSIAQPGSLDLTFNPNDFGNGAGFGANNEIYATALQTDGKILIGGAFTSYNGVIRNGIARLNTDGSLDPSFNPGSGVNFAQIRCIALKSNGKIVIGGTFTTYSGVSRNKIAQLNNDGTLDTSFDPGTGANNTVNTILVKSDGRILIGGFFDTYNGSSRNSIAGLNADGSLDSFFLPGTGAQGGYGISSIILQGSGPGGKIIIGGRFTTYQGVTKNNIARLTADGTIDNTFISGTGTNDDIYSLALQSDGKILVGGYFSSFNGTSRSRIVRLNFNGDVDVTFNPGTGTGATSAVYSIVPLSTGKIVIAGSFISYGGVAQKSISRLNSTGTLDATFNSGSNSAINSVSLQSDGKFILGGVFTGYDNVGQVRVTRINASGTLDPTFNPASGGANSSVNVIAMQADNKIMLAGYFTTYGGAPRKKIARANPDGSIDPSFDAGNGPYSDDIRAIVVQSDGKILVGGNFSYFYDFNAPNFITRLHPNGTRDLSFNSGGGGAGAPNGNGTLYKIIIQPDEKILICGFFTSYNGISRKCIARLNADGSLDTNFDSSIGIELLGSGATNPAVYDMCLLPDGKILLTGRFNSYNGTPVGSFIRLNSDGTLDNTFDTGTGATGPGIGIYISSIKLQPDNKIIIGGNFSSYNGTSINGLARLLPNGNLDPSFNTGTGVAGVYTTDLQTDGKIVITGAFTTYNTIPINKLARVNPDGSLDLSFDPGTSTGSNYISATALQSDEKILIGGSITSYNGIGRSYVARVNRNCVANGTGTDTRIACGSFTWADGKTYTANNTTAICTLFDAASNGCDSVIQLNLTILPIARDTIFETACDSYTWTSGNGQTYVSSIIANHIIPGGALNGCDSIITLNLTINHSTTGTDTIVACDSYTWIDGIEYIASNNTATYTLANGNASGCDSVVTLNLTINHPTTGADTITTCDSYTWIDGIEYTSSNNTATYTLVNGNALGCDSIITLHLTINHSTTGTDTQTACGSYTWINGTTYNSSNSSATHVLTAANGCDSVVTLNLTILQLPSSIDTHVSCGPFTWINGQTYTTSNTSATFIIANGGANGCDSIITLALTVTNITPQIIDNGNFLTTNFAGGDLYEWIDCSNQQVVFTGQVFNPTANGQYALKITKNVCEETSACHTVNWLGMEDSEMSKLVVYPNPASNLLSIDGGIVEMIRVLSMSGQELFSVSNTSVIDISHLTNGCYLIEINHSIRKTLIKQ